MATVQNRADIGPLDKGLDANSFLITPSDTVNLPVPIDALECTVGGTVTAIMPLGNSVTYTLADGATQFMNSAIRVMSTGTTATGLTGIASKALR